MDEFIINVHKVDDFVKSIERMSLSLMDEFIINVHKVDGLISNTHKIDDCAKSPKWASL